MNKTLFVIFAASTLALSASVVCADIGVNVKAGTLGAGVELSKGFSDKLSVGLALNAYTYKTTDKTSNVDYDYKFELQSAGLLANYHPFSGIFRLTAGVMMNNNELSLTGKPVSGATYTLNGVTYTASQVGTLTGKVTFNKTAPYLGLGWGSRPNGSFGLTADIGALYQGSPKLTLDATGALSDPALAANVRAERAKAESDLSSFKWYPVVSLGLYYRF